LKKDIWRVMFLTIGIPVSLFLYTLAALIVFIGLSVNLNTQRILKVIPQNRNGLNNKSNHTSNGTNPRWPAQYIKYVVRHYCKVIWGCDSISEILGHLAQRKNDRRNKNGFQNVTNLSPVPFNDKSLEGIHAKTVSQAEETSQPKGNVTVTKNWISGKVL